ncbi:MAG: MFS transporter [Oscillospiraceae bacterium]
MIFNTSLYLTGQLGIYFFKYDIGNEALFSLFGSIGGAAQILSMAIFPLLRRRFSCTQLFYLSLAVTAVGYAALFGFASAGVTSIAGLGAAAFVIYFGFGVATVLTTVFLADTIEYGEMKNGSRNESVIFSMQTFVVKLASAVSVLVAGVGLDVIRLDNTLPVQTPETLFGLRFIMTGVPMLGLALAAVVFKSGISSPKPSCGRSSRSWKKERLSKPVSDSRKPLFLCCEQRNGGFVKKYVRVNI